jgi:hypothetical protein
MLGLFLTDPVNIPEYFRRCVLVRGLYIGSFLNAVCVYVLWETYGLVDDSSYVLRLFCYVKLALYCVLFPLRTYFAWMLGRVKRADAHAGKVELLIMLCTSKQWRLAKKFGHLSMLWTLVWLFYVVVCDPFCVVESPLLGGYLVINVCAVIHNFVVLYRWLNKVIQETGDNANFLLRDPQSIVVPTKLDEYSEVMTYAAYRANVKGEGGNEENEEDDICCICHDSLTDSCILRVLHCKHYYHRECVDPWFLQRDACPMCGSKVDARASNQSSHTKAD